MAAPDIKSSIVKVVAKGIDTGAGNIKRVATGTGFFTSELGFIVTSAHLRKNLGKVDEASITYEIYLDRFSAAGIAATSLYLSDPSDLMVLYAPVGGENIKPLSMSRKPISSIKLGETAIFTAGYPDGYGYTVNQGVITAFSGPVHNVPLWATNLTFKEGQSGSPVYLASGEVIGIVKGVDRNASIGLFVPAKTIPSNYWDSGMDAAVVLAATSASAERLVASGTQLAVGPRDRTERAEFVNPPCTVSRRHVQRVLPSQGWAIDPDSVKLRTISIQAQNAEARVDAISAEGFELIVDVENTGKCLEINGIRIAQDIVGKYTGAVTFKERPKDAAEEKYTIAKAILVPGAKIPLGDINPSNVALTITGPNGSRIYIPKPGDIIREGGQQVLQIDKIPRLR